MSKIERDTVGGSSEEKNGTIKEQIIINRLKHFLSSNKYRIREGDYLGFNGTAEAFYAQAYEIYDNVLREGYSLNRHLSESQLETLFVLLDQINSEYVPKKRKIEMQKMVDILNQRISSLKDYKS